MLFTLFVMSTQNEKAVGVVLLATLIAFAVSVGVRKTRQDRTLPTVFCSAALSLILLLAANVGFRQSEAPPQTDVTISGVYASLPYTENGRHYTVLRVDRINGEQVNCKVRLVTTAPLDADPLDRVTAQVRLFTLGTSANDPDITAYYRSQKLTLGAYPTGDVTVRENPNAGISAHILQFRSALLETIRTVVPNDAGAVIAGLSLGANTLVPENVKNAFRASGISHLLVVSGLHLSTWTMYLFAALQRTGLRRRTCAGIGIAFVAFFVVLTGGAPSVVRAAVMSGTVYAAQLFRREAEPLNSVGIALAGMLAVNPYAARSLSLLLSVFSTVGILLLAKPIETLLCRPVAEGKSRWIRFYKAVASAVSVTVAVTVFTLPIQLWAFGTLSLASLPANLLSLTAGSLCMVSGTLGGVLTLLQINAVGKGLLLIAAALANYLLRVTAWFTAQKYTLLPVGSNYAKLLLAVALLTAAGFLLLRAPRVRRLRVTACVLTSVFLLCNASLFFLSEQALQMTVCDVGNGTAVVLRTNGETVLLCSGGNYYADSEICAILSAYGATHIDALFLPTAQEDSLSAALSVGAQLPVDTVYYAKGLKSETLSVGARKSPIDRTVLPLAGGEGRLAVQSAGAYSYAQIRFGEFSALISFQDGNDFHGSGGDALICTDALPQNIRPADFSLLIMNTEDAASADFAAVQSGSVCTTAENGSISLWIHRDGSFQYTRRS